MKEPSILKHFRDIMILPFTVTVVIPFLIHNPDNTFLSDYEFARVVGVILALMGLLLFINTVYLIRKIGKGTIAPWSSTKNLVIHGPYKHCRNPMITGVLLILIGESMFFQSANILIWAIVFFVINTIYFKLKEEPDMVRRFGAEYENYKKNVPRWIPKIRPYAEDE